MTLNIHSSAGKILEEFYKENVTAIEQLATEYLVKNKQKYLLEISVLFEQFRQNNSAAFPADNQNEDYVEKIALLNLCLASEPKVLDAGYNQRDLVLAGAKVQWPVLQNPTLSREIKESRVLQSAGLLSLSDGKILLYPAQGMVREFFKSAEKVPANAFWESVVEKIMALRTTSAIKFNKYDFTRTLNAIITQAQQDIISLCNTNDFQEISIDHVSKMLEAAIYAITKGALERDSFSEDDAGILGFILPIITRMSESIKVTASSWGGLTSAQRVKEFCDSMRTKVSLLLVGPIDLEEAYGGFFNPREIYNTPKKLFKAGFDIGETFDNDAIIRNDITGDNVDVSGEKYYIPKVCFDKIPTGSNDAFILKRFFTLNAEFLQQIDEKKCDPELCQIVLLRLWDAFANDEQCPVFVKENNERLKAAITVDSALIQDAVFSSRSRLNAVINSDKAVDANADFAKAVEAVAIVWSFPDVMSQEGIASAQKIAFEALDSTALDENAVFEAAVDWMRNEPGCVSVIQNYYTQTLKPSKAEATSANREKMLKRVLPNCLKSINASGNLCRLFNKGSIKKIEELASATSLTTIVARIPDEISNTENQANLEEFFLLKVKQMLNTLLIDFKTLFPAPEFFDQFSDQFSSEWGGLNLSIEEKRNRIVSGLMSLEVFNLDSTFLQNEGQSINYFFIAGLSNAVISFVRGFSERPAVEGVNFYDEFQRYIDTVDFPKHVDELNSAMPSDEEASNVYAAFPAALTEEAPTFMTSIFMKLSDQAGYDRIRFDQMLMLAQSIEPSVCASQIAKCLLDTVDTKDECQYRLNKLLQHNSDLFVQSIDEAASSCPDYLLPKLSSLFNNVIECTKESADILYKIVRKGNSLNLLRTLLYQAALDNKYRQLGELVGLLPRNTAASSSQRDAIQRESTASISVSSERDIAYRKSFFAHLDEQTGHSDVPDEDFIEKYLAKILESIKSDIATAMLKILDSNIPLLNKLQLVGAIAVGKDSQPRILVNPLSDKGRLYQALKIFNTIDAGTNISAVFSDFLTSRGDKKAARERGRSILIAAGKHPQSGETFTQYFTRWAQFCANTGAVVPLNLGWAGSPPSAADTGECNAMIASMGAKQKKAFEIALKHASIKPPVEHQMPSQARSYSFSSHHREDALSQVDNNPGRFKSFSEAPVSRSQHSARALLSAAQVGPLSSNKLSSSREDKSDIAEERNLIGLLNDYKSAKTQKDKQEFLGEVKKLMGDEVTFFLEGRQTRVTAEEALKIVLMQFKVDSASRFFRLASVPKGMQAIIAMIDDRENIADILLKLKEVATQKVEERYTFSALVTRQDETLAGYKAIDKFFSQPTEIAKNKNLMQELCSNIIEACKNALNESQANIDSGQDMVAGSRINGVGVN